MCVRLTIPILYEKSFDKELDTQFLKDDGNHLLLTFHCMTLLSMGSVTHSQPWSQKALEIIPKF